MVTEEAVFEIEERRRGVVFAGDECDEFCKLYQGRRMVRGVTKCMV